MNKSNKSANAPKSILVWPVAVLLMAAASLPLKAEKPESLDLLSLALKDISTLKTSLGTATPVVENGQAVAIDFEFLSSDHYPGVEIPTPDGGWDLSSFVAVEAEIENISGELLLPVLAIANKYNMARYESGVGLLPGKTGILRVKFGYFWGDAVDEIDLQAVDYVRVYIGPNSQGAFLIKSIRAVRN